MEMNGGALQGVTILDLTRVLSGPFCTSWLSDMGATIIKVENPGEGDHTRTSEPFVNGESAYYATLNRNKKCITLNLKSARGKELFLELVKKADVVTENFRPGVMDKLGLGYEELKKVNPRIILASLSGYGSYGPYAGLPGYDTISQGMGGIMSITGFPDSPPTRCGPSLGDVVAGMNLAIGVLAALHSAEKTGVGQKLEVALVDSILALCTQDFIEYGLTKELPPRMGNQYRIWCPYGTYPAKDGYYQLGVGTEQHFKLLCTQVMGRPDMAADERFDSQFKRTQHREEVESAVNAWAAQFTVREVVDKLRAVGIPSCPVYNFADIEADENFTVHRQMIKHMQHPTIGDIPYVNMPVRFFGTPLVEPKAAGRLGQFNEEILGDYLGLSEEEICALAADGVI